MRTTNMQTKLFTKGGLLVVLSVVGVAICSNRASAGHIDVSNVTAGHVMEVDGDLIQNPIGILRFRDGGDANFVASAVLDLGSVQQVVDIVIQNRLTTDTTGNAGQLQIFVAPDEAAGGFDAALSSSFTDMVFDGSATPNSATAGIFRTAALTSTSTKQYFLLNFRSQLSGGLFTTGGNFVDTNDLLVNVIPEPTGFVLTALGGGVMLLFRRRRSVQ